MTSSEKILAFLESIDELDDTELAEMFPVPARFVRLGVAGASTRVPLDHAELDEWALKAALWCLSMRSDNLPGLQLTSAGVTVAELAAAQEPAP